MSKLKTFPVDLLGTAPSNKVSGEVRVIERNEDRIFIPTGGPFYTKSLKMWAGSVPLTLGVDFKAKELNRNGTIDSGKEVCNAIQILNKGTTFTFEYQVIGGEYAELGEELADFIKGTPIGDLTKIHWDNILYKPLTFPPTPHTHTANEWRGYGDSIWIVEQLTAGLSTGRNGVYNAVKEEVKRKVEEYVREYISRYGVVVTDSTPTNNGNVFMVGNGKQPTPLALDINALFQELDTRYFRNVINPLTRIGTASDNFLPIITGFFNVTSPLITERYVSSVAKVERNGDLLTLIPATDGEVVRYVYGYVRRFTQVNALSGFKTTNQQYRPPGLGTDEEIMELFGITNQTMLAGIYTIQSSGKAAFKEHAIIELNDTLMQESHTLRRIGNGLLNATGRTVDGMGRGRPLAARMRDGTYYLLSFPVSNKMGGLQCHMLNADNSVSRIDNWNGFKETRVVEHVAGSADRVLSKTNVASPTLVAGTIQPFHWLRSEAGGTNSWIIDDTLASEGYSYGMSRYNDDLVAYVKGDEIFCNISMNNRIALYSATEGWRQNADSFAGASYRIAPKSSTFHWLRSKSQDESAIGYYVNAEQGFYRQLADNPNAYEYRVPYDMAGGPNDVSGYWVSTQIRLADGQVLWFRPRGRNGDVHRLYLAKYNQVNPFDVTDMFNGYTSHHFWRLSGGQSVNIAPSVINLENPTTVPLEITALPFNDNLVLLQTGNGTYGGGPANTTYYAYKPSSKLVNYKTMDLGSISGYDVSDDRKLIESNTPSNAFVFSRLSDGAVRYSNMVFQRRPEGADPTQTIYRSVRIDYNAGKLIREQPYTFTQVGHDAIEFALNSLMGNDRYAPFTSWGLIISPEDPTVALFDCMASTSNRRDFKIIRCAARLQWNTSNVLVGFQIRPLTGQVTNGTHNITSVISPDTRRWYNSWAIQYNADKSEAHWHGRHFSGFGYPGNANGSSGFHSYRMSYAEDGFPVLLRYSSTANSEGRRVVVATPAGIGISWDHIAFGVYRVFQPFKNWDWTSGIAWDETPSKAFVWYSPRPTVSFKLRLIEDIEVQIGGVYSSVPRGDYELSDPHYSTIVDPRNKTILIYASLLRGQATLEFVEYALPESVYTTYLGKCVTDEYGITEADIIPLSRIANYRASSKPQGMAFSASSGTANIEQLLNWDADIPATLVSERVRGFINGADNLSQGASIVLSAVVTPESTEVVSRVWSSLDPSIATVNQSGVVTGVRAGQVTIKCLINDEVTATKNITIAEVKKVSIPSMVALA